MSELIMKAEAEEAYQRGFSDGIDATNAARNEKVTAVFVADPFENGRTVVKYCLYECRCGEPVASCDSYCPKCGHPLEFQKK